MRSSSQTNRLLCCHDALTPASCSFFFVFFGSGSFSFHHFEGSQRFLQLPNRLSFCFFGGGKGPTMAYPRGREPQAGNFPAVGISHGLRRVMGKGGASGLMAYPRSRKSQAGNFSAVRISHGLRPAVGKGRTSGFFYVFSVCPLSASTDAHVIVVKLETNFVFF